MAGGVTRGDVRLYEFAAPDKNRPVVVLTRDSAIAYLANVSVRTDHIHCPWRAVRSTVI